MTTPQPLPTTKTLSNVLYNIFLSVDFPANSIKFAVAQALHETGNKIDQPHETNGHNWSGITYIGQPMLQKKAKRGNLKPQKDWNDPNKPEYYAWFDTIEDWARDFKRIISRSNGLKGRPIEATTLKEYATRLKANFYFRDTIENYSKALNYWLDKIKTTLPATNTAILIFIAIGIFYLL